MIKAMNSFKEGTLMYADEFSDAALAFNLKYYMEIEFNENAKQLNCDWFPWMFESNRWEF